MVATTAADSSPAVNSTSPAISTSNKSRGQLKRLKKKAKGKGQPAAEQHEPVDDRPRERAPTVVRPLQLSLPTLSRRARAREHQLMVL